MAGKQLDSETLRENKRLTLGSPAVSTEKTLANVQEDVVSSEISKLVASGQVPRGGFTSREQIAEQQIESAATPAEKSAVKKLQNTAWATSSPKIQQESFSQAAVVSGGKGLPWSKSYTQYPGIALATAKAINNGVINRDQLKTINAAVEIVDNAQQLLSAQSNVTRQHILSRLPEGKQMAVVSAAIGIAEEWKALQAATMTQSGDQSPILQALGKASGAVVEGWNWLSEQGQHYGRMWQNTWTTGNDPIQAWNATARNRFDKNAVAALGSEFGDDLVSVVQDVVSAQQHNPDFTWTDLLAKYENNQYALHVIDATILSSERDTVPGLSDLLGKMNAARADNLGGAVANSVLPSSMEGTSPVWTGVSKGVNVFTLLTLDPTLAAGKAYRGYHAFRYGLERAFNLGTLEKAFSNPASARFLSSLADDVARYNDAAGSSAGKIAGEMKIKYGKYLTDDAIESIAQYAKVEGKSAVADSQRFVHGWLDDMRNYTRLLEGQSARRAGDRLAPRMTIAQQARINARLKMRDVISFDKNNDPLINAIIGADLDAADIQAARAIGIDPKTVSAQNVADALQDPAIQKRLAEEFGLESSSFAARILTNAPKSSTVRNRWDKVFRQFELMPRGRQISIDSASDAQKIYLVARTTFSKSLSETLRETWKFANPGERRLLLNGMFDTIASARGINLDETLEDGVTTLRDYILTSGSKGSEQYAATVAGFDAVPFGTPLEQYSQRLTRAILPKLDDAGRDRVNAINAKLAQFFEQQKRYKIQIDALKGDIAAQTELRNALGDLDGMIQKNLDALDAMVKQVKLEKGRGWGAGSALLKERKALKADGEIFAYNPAEVAGKQHAIHLFQMADSILIPDFAALQRYQQRRGVLNAMLGKILYSEASTNIVDIWSAANLMSPRYVMRNAPEDWLGYILSGGSIESALKGRAMSTLYREIRGRKLGIVQENARNVADSNALLGKWLLSHMPESDVRLFMDAIKNGDADVAERIAGTAFARVQAGALGRKLDQVDENFFKVLSSTSESSRLVDDVAEIRGDLNNGRLISAADGGPAPQMRASMSDLRKQKVGEYTNVPFDHLDTDAYVAWHEMLVNILHNDGRAGQIVFNAMRYADKYKGGLVSSGWDKYKERLIEFFSDETKSGEWWSKSSMLQEVGPEQFARRYFDAASNYFAHEGIVNGNLVKSLTRETNDGIKYGAMHVKDAGEFVERFSPDDLRQFGRFERPQYILGKTLKTVAGTDDVNMVEKGFAYLGESLARISREPLFFANALDEWRAAQPQIARWVADGLDEVSAQKIVMESVLERARNLTISYIDNPNIRTQLAFNARNVARYYRATEDFYRRALRLASYKPEQMQKLNLVYQNMNNSGFMWQDDQGTQYFVYPGTGIVNEAIAKCMSIFNASPMLTNPFVLGGQTLMLTPSSDPASLLPTFASPITAAPLKALTAIGPFKWLEPVLLGSRGTKQTGSASDLGWEIAQSLLPSPVLRLLQLAPAGDRNTQLASATFAAMRYAEYAGSLDRRKDESDEGYQKRVKTELGNMAWGTLALRFIFGFATPASPQLLAQDDLTEAARSLGIKNLRSGYTQLLNKYNGDYDRATAEWWKINPNLMPYTVSSTEAKGQGYPSMTSDSGKWLVQNSDFVLKHPAASPFLTPDTGSFSFSTYGLVSSLGMIQGKTTDRAWLELATQIDYYSYMETKKDADAALAAEPSASARNAIRERWAEIKQQMFTENPFLAIRASSISEQSSEARKESALQDMRFALKEIYSSNKSMVNDRTDRIMSMINTFDDGMSDIGRFGGNTNYAVDSREALRAKLRSVLDGISSGDRGASDFFDRVLDPLIG